jgi:hypothetical protein
MFYCVEYSLTKYYSFPGLCPLFVPNKNYSLPYWLFFFETLINIFLTTKQKFFLCLKKKFKILEKEKIRNKISKHLINKKSPKIFHKKVKYSKILIHNANPIYMNSFSFIPPVTKIYSLIISKSKTVYTHNIFLPLTVLSLLC